MLTNGRAAKTSASGHAVRSNIQAGTSSQRSACDPSSVQRKTTSPALSTTPERKLGDQTKDDADKEPREEWSCGRSQALLYNGRRPHQSLDDATPDQAYFNQPPFRLAA